MLTITLFALIGDMLNAGAPYWIIFGIYSAFKMFHIILNIARKFISN